MSTLPLWAMFAALALVAYDFRDYLAADIRAVWRAARPWAPALIGAALILSTAGAMLATLAAGRV